MKKDRFTASYLRFHTQLKALQKGKLNLVKKLASEARSELEASARLNQLKLRFSSYENSLRN